MGVSLSSTQVGKQGRGVPTVATILNITRVYNAVSSAAAMRTVVDVTRDFASKRNVFGRPLHEQPLHIQTLATLELEARGGIELAFFTVSLLGKVECGFATESEAVLLRFLTPLNKLYLAKSAVWVSSEGMEALGGMGYIEDTGLPTALRNSQVGTIWEGTTNILSLDLLRVIGENLESLGVYEKAVFSRLESAKKVKDLALPIKTILSAYAEVKKYMDATVE